MYCVREKISLRATKFSRICGFMYLTLTLIRAVLFCFQSLLNMYLENNTDLGKQVAAQTLAKIAITQDPKITFSGQRVSNISLLICMLSVLQTF